MKKKITILALFVLIIVSNIFAIVLILDLKEEIETSKVLYLKKLDEMKITVKQEIEREMVINNPIYFVGASIVRRNEWQEAFPNVSIVNKGIDGNKISDLLRRIDKIADEHPSKIFLLVGTNDFLQNKEISDMVKNYEIILQIIKTKSPYTEIYVHSLLPISRDLLRYENADIMKFNIQIKTLANKFKVNYVDLFPLFLENGKLAKQYSVDGVHLNEKGYDVWERKIDLYVK